MRSSKLTSKHQATIPKEIRKVLNLQPGDSITFVVTKDGSIIVKKNEPLDTTYLQALNNTLSEWESEADEKAYEHLQNL